MQEAPVRCLGQEDPLEKGMAAHSRILAWKIPGTEEPGRLQSFELQRTRLSDFTMLCSHGNHIISESEKRASQVSQAVKNLPVHAGDAVRSLGDEDPLE